MRCMFGLEPRRLPWGSAPRIAPRGGSHTDVADHISTNRSLLVRFRSGLRRYMDGTGEASDSRVADSPMTAGSVHEPYEPRAGARRAADLRFEPRPPRPKSAARASRPRIPDHARAPPCPAETGLRAWPGGPGPVWPSRWRILAMYRNPDHP